MGDLQLDSDVGSQCNMLLDVLSYSRSFTRVRRNLPGATVCSCVHRTRQLHTLQYFAHNTSNLPKNLNPLTPNDPYRGRTSPLTSKVAFYIFTQQIQVLNISNMVYTLRFFLFKMQFFHNSNVFGSCIIHTLYTGCAKIKKI